MQEDTARIKSVLVRILPVFAFLVPFLILYWLYPTSFEATWKGRTYYLFFLWILCLEMILDWEELHPNIQKLRSKRALVLAIFLFLPTLYVITANYFGLNQIIVDISPRHLSQNSPADPFWANLMPLSIEYLVFAGLFVAIVLAEYGTRGLKKLPLSPCLIAIMGFVYVIDNLYPYGEFTPFQIFVPTTAIFAEKILNFIGYQTRLILGGSMPVLQAMNANGGWSASIAWPCSGVESLIIYTLTILLFLKKTVKSWTQGIVYFVVGAVVTYSINALRIVTIFVIAIDKGDWGRFHDYYGQLYSITWIVSYPLIIIGSQMLWSKIRSWQKIRDNRDLQGSEKSPQPSLQ